MLGPQCGFNMKYKQIYLDHASSRPVNQDVFNYAKPYLMKKFGNPSSLYNLGLESKSALEDARDKIADFINAKDSKNIIFTNSATESNNIAIKGTAIRNINDGKNIASSSIEHISVINPMKELQLTTCVPPHIKAPGNLSTAMRDVIIALMPAFLASVYFFGLNAVFVTGVCILSCMMTEFFIRSILGRPFSLNDGSAVLTGLLLALSLPPTTPWWLAALGGIIAIGVTLYKIAL